MPNQHEGLNLFFLSKSFYKSIIDELNQKQEDLEEPIKKQDSFILNYKVYDEIINSQTLRDFKDKNHIPTTNIFPVKSDFYNLKDAGPIANELIKFGCMHILKLSFDTIKYYS